jgi:hypothetical protein
MSDRASLLDRLTGGPPAPGDDPRAAQFVRGLAIGALVGAAIAGSTLWQRRRGGDRRGIAAGSTAAQDQSSKAPPADAAQPPADPATPPAT